jgi:hypothetical protein
VSDLLDDRLALFRCLASDLTRWQDAGLAVTARAIAEDVRLVANRQSFVECPVQHRPALHRDHLWFADCGPAFVAKPADEVCRRRFSLLYGSGHGPETVKAGGVLLPAAVTRDLACRLKDVNELSVWRSNCGHQSCFVYGFREMAHDLLVRVTHLTSPDCPGCES